MAASFAYPSIDIYKAKSTTAREGFSGNPSLWSRQKKIKDVSMNLEQKLKSIRLTEYKKHIFLCVGPKCLDSEKCSELWLHLKQRCKDLAAKNIVIQRSKADCLRICRQGAVAVVYPEGIWYTNINLQVLDRIIDEHLVQDKPVEEFVLHRLS